MGQSYTVAQHLLIVGSLSFVFVGNLFSIYPVIFSCFCFISLTYFH